ncbi:hypothetical protein TWF173_001680 [Orbilia oligospora]|nr:hypothetical protein TWF173_001680 [Orbilia oligospora]
MTKNDTEPSLQIENPAPVILSSPADGKQFPLGDDFPNFGTAGYNNRNDSGIAYAAAHALGTHYITPAADDIMDQPISTNAPPAMFERKNDHPVDRLGVINMDGVPVGTNKFWANLILGNGNLGVFTQPYQVWINKDPAMWGLSISHIDAPQIVTGPDPNANPVQYYFNPVGVNSLTFSALELSPMTSTVTVEALKPQSALVQIWVDRSRWPATRRLTVPLVQGMGFVTGRYREITPKINSGVLIRNLSYVGTITGGGMPRQKWRVTLMDGKEWRIYATANAGSRELQLRLVNSSTIVASGTYSGAVQIAKLPNTALEKVLDDCAGTVVTDAVVSASVSAAVGTYTFTFVKQGGSVSNAAFMYAFPHQVASFDGVTRSKLQAGLQLKSTTKGLMTAIASNSWTLLEPNMPVSVGWLPGSFRKWNARQLAVIRAATVSEIGFDVINGSNLPSQYFSGKALAKYAQILLVASDVLKDKALVERGLLNLRTAINRFATNKQKFPLVYDSKWGGLPSSSWWVTRNPDEDFGNAWYNDHHFHYGYFIYAAAVLVHVERTHTGSSPWLAQNSAYVNTLVRDVANPTPKDKYFPVSRSFDFFNGHSWATGLYARADGKDEESTSEDYNFSYAMKLWGNVIGDKNMEARANLQLAILKRSFNSYFLLSSDNRHQPANFIQNKVTGILFENKVDHTTYFGNQIEYIQGIHMLPLTPISPYIRSKTFCYEEWQRFFDGRTETMNSGWKGVLWANAAIFAPNAAFNFFAGQGFQASWLDDGASRTWYLVFAAGLGGGGQSTTYGDEQGY